MALKYYFSLGKRPYVGDSEVHPEVIKFTNLLAPGATQERDEEIIWVFPETPTAAGETQRYPLLGTDILRLHFVQTMHLIPEIIDVSRFQKALSKALALYPTFAGRLRIDSNNDRSISLTNSSIPLVIDRDAQGPALGDFAIIGYHMGSYLAPINLHSLENHDEALISIKLSMFPRTGETAIGVMMSHQVADGHLALAFMRTLSNLYQGFSPEPTTAFIIPSPAPLPPISIRRLFNLLSAVKNDPRYKPNTYTETEAHERTIKSIEESVPVNIRVTAQQMAKLKTLAVAGLPEGGNAQISRQDAVTALLVTSMNKFLDVKVDHVRSVWNYRAITSPVHYGGNAIGLSMTDTMPTSDLEDLSAVSSAIRNALIKARSEEEFGVMLPLMHLKLTDMANRGQFIGSVLLPGRFVINSDVNADWRAAHFGHPDTVRFFSAHKENRYARVYQSNPEIIDGKVVDPRKGSIDVHLRIDASIHDQFVAELNRVLQSLE
ncbi:hypothetical protein DL93DRAFT_2074851 [Clavulina sp. PMI_390]|nr:hypothetical protein DL93DRAFT_2074851 [Clavulina sp. PMI_390]